jgi:Transposase IS66 family
VLPGYEGIIVRDGYKGYEHLTGALHAWCAVHLLRDLKDLYDFEPARQDWAAQMASLLTEARAAAAGARAAGQDALDPAVLDDLVTRYRGLAATGLTANLYRHTATAADARRLARRFRIYEDLILRFVTRPDLDIFSNNEAADDPPGQGPAAQLRRLLADPSGPRRLRARPVLPVHRHQMGHQQARRPPRPVQRPAVAPARARTNLMPHQATFALLAISRSHPS